MKVYIAPSFLKYYTFSNYREYDDNGSYKRPFDILKHAEDIIANNDEKDYLSDAIININRAITMRIKDIKKKFNFSYIPYLKSKDIWSRLEELGLIRKHLINEINRIRNQIEHEDRESPSLDICRLYVEFAWYFLKATNLLCIRKIDEINFEIDDYYWVECIVDFDNQWNTSVYGWFKEDEYSLEPCDGFIEIDADRLETRKELIQKGIFGNPKETGRGKNDFDAIINGKLLLKEEEFIKIYKHIFAVYQDT